MSGRNLAILLVLAAIGVGIQNYVFFSSLPAAPEILDDWDEEDEFLDEEELDDPLAEVGVGAFREWLALQSGDARSPFLTRAESLAAGGGTSSRSLPALQGTLVGDHRRVAFLDGRAHTEGQWVGSHRIARIEADRVVLERSGERVAIGLPERRSPSESSSPGPSGIEASPRVDD